MTLQLKEELDLKLNLNDEKIETLKKEVRDYIKNENINTSVLKIRYHIKTSNRYG